MSAIILIISHLSNKSGKTILKCENLLLFSFYNHHPGFTCSVFYKVCGCTCVCVSFGLQSSSCLFIFISMHLFVFSIVCLSEMGFILSLRIFLAVCVSPQLSVWYSPEPCSTLLLSYSLSSALARGQIFPPLTLTAITTGTQGLSIFLSFTPLQSSSALFLNYSIFRLAQQTLSGVAKYHSGMKLCGTER